MAGVGTELIEALILLGFTVLACRWAFGTRGVRPGRRPPDYGLLCPALRTDTEDAAQAARDQLAAAGIRATVAAAGPGFTAAGRPWPPDAHVVLVFAADLEAAVELVGPARSR